MIGMTMCSGIGAPEMAAPWIDWRFASEIEPFPRAVLQERFCYRAPDQHNQGDPLLWGDMTEITPDLLRSRGIPLPDLIVAGTPCQAFSVAGARKGLEDPRGNLTLAFVEICHAIVAARPDGRLAVLWENVPGVLSDSGNAFGCFLGGLVGAVDALPPPADGSWPGEGMVQGPRARAAWAVLDAQWFGVAQRRRRVFVVVDFGNCVDPAAVLLEPDRLRGDSPPRREAGERPAPTISARTKGGGGLGTDFDCDGGLIASHDPAATLQTSCDDYSRADGFNMVAHTLKGEGFDASEDGTGRQNLVPVAFAQNQRGEVRLSPVSPQLTCGGGKPGEGYPAIALPMAFDCKGTEVQFSTDGSHPTLRSIGRSNSHQNAGGHAAIAFAIQERATCENPNAGPDGAGYRADDAAYTLEARPVVQAVAFDLNQITSKANRSQPDPAVHHTLPASSCPPHLATPWAVRRLTPTECSRLQGFPDQHTAITHRGKPAADGPRYKALGNSMAVPVIAHILQRMHISMTGRTAA